MSSTLYKGKRAAQRCFCGPACTYAKYCSRVWLFATPWTVAHQALLSMRFSRQEYWSGLPCPPPGGLLHTGIEPCLLSPLHCRQILYLWCHLGSSTLFLPLKSKTKKQRRKEIIYWILGKAFRKQPQITDLQVWTPPVSCVYFDSFDINVHLWNRYLNQDRKISIASKSFHNPSSCPFLHPSPSPN